jgi:hypothetical protein
MPEGFLPMTVYELLEHLQNCDKADSQVQIKGRDIAEVFYKSNGGPVQITLIETPCEAEECSYFTHYLANYYPTEGFEKLDHIGFHGAEKNCNAIQQRCQEWMDNPANKNKRFPEHLERQALHWERKVCA